MERKYKIKLSIFLCVFGLVAFATTFFYFFTVEEKFRSKQLFLLQISIPFIIGVFSAIRFFQLWKNETLFQKNMMEKKNIFHISILLIFGYLMINQKLIYTEGPSMDLRTVLMFFLGVYFFFVATFRHRQLKNHPEMIPQQKTTPSINKKFIIGLFIILFAGIFYISSFASKDTFSQRSGYNLKATELIYEGKYDEAEKLLITSLEQLGEMDHGDVAVIHENLGLIYERKNQIEKSIEHYQTAVSFYDSMNSGYYSNLGKIDILKGNIDDAINNFEKALELNSNDKSANNMLGLIYLGKYDSRYIDFPKALIYNKKADELLKDFTTGFNLASNYYELHEYNHALVLFYFLEKSAPNDANVKYYIGLITMKLGGFETARKYFDEARKLNPSLPDVNISFEN